MTALAAAIAMLAGVGVGIGIGIATAKAAESVGRQPEAFGRIFPLFLLGAALAEAVAIYSFVIAFMLITKI
ncbi:ATP synthase F0 subunit C [Caldicellulosiruptor morganii]|uniref:ATP synthase subunit c n=1 Tax=Caldicellulosiruptor morganii TaxID=1387555 RepID=A0ABY7BPY1_9FIRM|nr:ATP synthase F0 subunit C [Caldicellulosiruptor morganii]WAM34870.1 ATP synthase F0 subunit C [Caldicellulosiruptor morganii]